MFESKKKQKKTFSKVIIWSKSKLLTGPSWGSKKEGQLGPVNNFGNLRAHFFNFKKCAETPIL